MPLFKKPFSTEKPLEVEPDFIVGDVGESKKLNLYNKQATFDSSDRGVATVDVSGQVTLCSPGITTILIESLDGKEQITVPVTVRGAVSQIDGLPDLTLEQRVEALENQAHSHEGAM